MSSEALYEQYKDALKRGHVASLRGRVEESLLAYAEAARIAPERSAPHSSAGNALLRRKRPAEALRHYEVALAIAPRDEVALLGRAHALAALDRRGDAADAFDALAEAQARGGRLADAVDAARRGLEMAEGRERRRTLERLIAQLRATEPDEPGRVALDHALLVLEGPAVPQAKRQLADGAGSSRAQQAQDSASRAQVLAASDALEGAAAASGGLAEVAGPDVGVPEVAGAGLDEGATHAESADALRAAQASEATDTDLAAAERADAAGESPEAAASVAPEARVPQVTEPDASSAATAMPGRAPRVVPADVTVAELEARAESELEAGSPQMALEARLDLAALHEREGRSDAALDACYEALSLDPDSVALHLALAKLYARRGWDGLADTKLDLLERIARLDGDEAVAAEVASVRAGRG